MYERFTDRARKVMQLAESEAKRLNHTCVAAEHIMLGMLAEGHGVAGAVLKNLGVHLEQARLEIWEWEPAQRDINTHTVELPLTDSAKLVIDESLEECRKLNHNYVGTEHMLLSLCRQREGLAARMLIGFGLKLDDIRQEVLNVLGHG